MLIFLTLTTVALRRQLKMTATVELGIDISMVNIREHGTCDEMYFTFKTREINTSPVHKRPIEVFNQFINLNGHKTVRNDSQVKPLMSLSNCPKS